ncbi:hypothetical protein ACO0LF_18685 [Undibacterium sp. Di27W]|uniref:hypothetical protein n=1 Tax=Undibacterium sp. Di27W TaxID=3413036 RepID=UPI003BF00FEF
MKHFPTKSSTSNLKSAGLIAGIVSSFLLFSTCVAADRDDTSARSRYEQERSLCDKGQSNQSRETCLREAGAARQQARAGSLTTESEEQLQRNRERRCEAHAASDREYCLQRMRGEGTQSGSAERGGILRELTVTTKPAQ